MWELKFCMFAFSSYICIMKSWKTIRIVAAAIMLAASVAYAFFSVPRASAHISVVNSQIVPSMLGATIGAALFWLTVSLFYGRIYCASFCPIGIMQDITINLRRRFGRQPRWRYTHRKRVRVHILCIYVVCLVVGLMIVPYLLEPWNIFLNISSLCNPSAVQATWIRLGVSAGTGFIGGIVTLLLILIWAWREGREFCNVVCPIGTALSLTETSSTRKIKINPDKCINCLKCEEICRGRCIKIVSRYVDDARCVRCFDCINICPNQAITMSSERRRPASPLSQRVKSPNA